ncbi:hypothetical protein BOTBODRAFT_180546 [Botryobasidium botryosum FD-172 SS1]|uniref:Uncharacterized protein n=1 Tax=Botryobasidium botryosum (strain FD-172 SS1) TaxID=930990 RepID=A0A067LYV9_BOTB1|nr:hypothetical protein BOTBODRAFT_180546 [Botryobasidium botryosum FD-172 SS1]
MRRHLAISFLVNSKGAPLKIKLAPGPQDTPYMWYKNMEYHKRYEKAYFAHAADIPNFLSPLLSHIFRWQSLELFAIPQPDELVPLLRSRAPLLKVLTLQAKESGLATSRSEGHPTIFLGSTPSLRHVNLSGFSPPLSSSLYTGLVTLTLSDINFPPHSIHLFLRNLSECPLLTKLPSPG